MRTEGRPPDRPPVNRPGLVQPADGRSVLSTSVGITLVVAGAILRFAATAMSAHVAGVIVMLAGIFALLLSPLVWGPLGRRRSHCGGHDHGPPQVARKRVYRKPVARRNRYRVRPAHHLL